jgi:O-antigen/teichoic acid export membrane protein
VLGVYSIAATLGALPTEAVFKLGNAVVFPAYSRLVGRHDFGHLFWKVRLPLVVIGAALVAVLLGGGPFLVRFLYDVRYENAGWILQFVAAGAWFRMLEVTNSAALLAQGRVSWMAGGNAAKVAGMILLVPMGFSMAGVPGALAGMAVSDLLKYLASATGAYVAGLRVFARDALLTAGVAVTSLAAYALGALAAERIGHNLAGLLLSPVVAAAPWGALVLYLVRRRRADSAGTSGPPAPA